MRSIITIGSLVFAAGAAHAGVSSFTESFEAGANGWLQGGFTAPVYSASGAADGRRVHHEHRGSEQRRPLRSDGVPRAR